MSDNPNRPQIHLPQKRRKAVPVALITVAAVAFLAVVGGGWLLVRTLMSADSSDAGGPVAGQLRWTFPTRPDAGWRLDADEVFEGAAFVRPDPTSHQYHRPGFIDLGDVLITSAMLPRTDRGFDLLAVDARTGAIRWQVLLKSGRQSLSGLDVSPASCATAAVDGLLPCVVADSVQFFDLADGSVERRLPAPPGTSIVEVHGSDVYSLGYETMARGTTSNLTARWQRTYRIDPQCPGSGDSQYHGVTDDIVYFGSDAGVVVAASADGRRLLDREVQHLRVFPGQGLTGAVCGSPPSSQSTVVADAGGQVLRSGVAPLPAEPWLVEPTARVPVIQGDTAYDFATGEQRWVTSGDARHGPLSKIVGDVVLADSVPGYRGEPGLPLAAFDLSTGQQLWASEGLAGIALSDGHRVIAGHADGAAAVNLATGQRDWILPGVSAGDLDPAGDGFASADADRITFYAPTGGAAVAPGRRAPPAPEEEGGPVTKCGRTPEMRPVEYRAESGGVRVRMEVRASCPGGDVIASNRFRVTIRDDLSRIASDVFDFSANPMVLMGDGEATEVELWFGDAALWRHPNTLGEQSRTSSGRGDVVTSARASGREVVDCADEGGAGTGVTDTGQPPRPGSTKAVSGSGGDRADCGSDQEALAALRAQVDTDRPFVQRGLADRWVAQLSSKQPGLVAPDVDGRVVTWTPCEILRQHLRMRLQYPEVRLVWSDEWRTFDLRGWWVTIAGVTFGDPDAANAWCSQRGIAVDECYAKVVSDHRDSRGTTKYRR